MNRPEPAAVAAAVKEFVSSLLKLIIMFGLLKLTVEQFGMVMIVFDSFVAVLMVLFIRSNVTPTSSPQVSKGTVVRVEDVNGTITEKKV